MGATLIQLEEHHPTPLTGGRCWLLIGSCYVIDTFKSFLYELGFVDMTVVQE